MQPIPLWQLLAQAGWTMVPLYLCSLAALAVILKKAVEFWVHRVGSTTPLDLCANPHLSPDELVAALRSEGSPLGRVMAAAAADLPNGAELAEREAGRAATAELDRYDQWLPLLDFVAQAAPMFGLLGTVLGMIDLFAAMHAAGTDVSTATLSGGIWKALLTTAAGLMIAVPTIGAHLWFSRRLDGLQHRMEEGVGRLLDRRRAERAPLREVGP